jgi:predicted HNH restriction endonuclease
MINKKYRDSALETYGHACEICGHRVSLEVHHINYQAQHQMEDTLRHYFKHDKTEFNKLLKEAIEQGFVEFKSNQLAKDDSTTNLSVLCGNCHGFIHTMDVGMKLVKALPARK